FVRRPWRSSFFPYTTLFRSHGGSREGDAVARVEGTGGPGLGRIGVLDVLGLVQNDAGPLHPLQEGLIPGHQAVAGHDEMASGNGDRKSTRLNSSHVKISYAV